MEVLIASFCEEDWGRSAERCAVHRRERTAWNEEVGAANRRSVAARVAMAVVGGGLVFGNDLDR